MKASGRPPILDNEEGVIHWFTGVYYKELEKEPTISLDLDKNISLIENINEHYKLYLNRYKKFDYEGFEGKFIENIEFLTKVFEKRGKNEELKQWKKEFRDKVPITNRK